MKRHPGNRNLHVYTGRLFKDFPVMYSKGPFIYQYLERTMSTIRKALDQYPRVFAFRVDLRVPIGWESGSYCKDESVITEFFGDFKSQIKSKGDSVRRLNKYAHVSNVRYVWAREQGAKNNSHHYHVLFLLNRDAFYTLGRLGSTNINMITRLERAWSYATGVPMVNIQGLVNIPENAEYRIDRNDPESQAILFERASYLCKVATKKFGFSYHVFGSSRG